MQQAVQARIIQGDALDVLRTLPAESVQCVVTSPPYFGLRDYGTAEWDGGEDSCDHLNSMAGPTRRDVNSELRQGRAGPGMVPYRDNCGKCGATRIDAQIGLESSPAEYVAKMVAVFREVRRVLRKDGVCWLNIGDSYAGGKTGRADLAEFATSGGMGNKRPQDGQKFADTECAQRAVPDGLKPKDLCGMPWRLAFALQADGWYLRQDIIWAKPNPMPESVTDRCTKAHEYIFLLSKSERYFYDADAISEEASQPLGDARQVSQHKQAALNANGSGTLGTNCGPDRRNKRSVWTITTEPYPEAHFATFPTELPRICILAGSRIGDTILDPFAGSGTTLQVALELSRAAIGIELNADYVALANRRLNGTTLGLPLEIAA